MGVSELVGEAMRIILHLNVPKIRTNAEGRAFGKLTIEHLAATWNKDGAITAMECRLPLHRAVSTEKRRRKKFFAEHAQKDLTA